MLRLVVSLALAGASAQMEGMGGLGSGRRMRDKEPQAVKSDLKCIKCDVCEMAVDAIYDKVEVDRKAAPVISVNTRPGAPKTKKSTFSEADVNAIVYDACNRRKDVGDWLWYVDVVDSAAPAGGDAWRALTKKEKASGDSYLMVESRKAISKQRKVIRKWDRESATIRQSCANLFEDEIQDLDELIVPLWRGDLNLKAAKALACKDLSNRCGSARAKAPAGREDFPFEEQDASLLDTEKMMDNMAAQGMPMVMQSREDMMDELLEQLMSEGMSAEEAKEFMDETTKNVNGGGDALEGGAPDL
ncbi:hypothetical protein M885DRAFT_585754 [Pelagophyceae sp. CCMP2097]|nr:hypothetical protein M885DRAFT_585754 [Pelagophyceae sp. CCMP2097]